MSASGSRFRVSRQAYAIAVVIAVAFGFGLRILGIEPIWEAFFFCACCMFFPVSATVFAVEMAHAYAEMFSGALHALAWTLQRPRLKATILLVAIAALSAGFIFDLLGS